MLSSHIHSNRVGYPLARRKTAMSQLRFAYTTAVLSAFILSSSSLADGVAPNYGKCSPQGNAGRVTLQTVEAGTLTVATVLPNPGFWNGVTPAGIKDGFEYCIAAEIAHQAGLRTLKVKNLAWDQFISGTATGYDIAIASTTITEPRREHFDFSKPYFSSNLGVAVKAGSDVTAENITRKRVGVLQGNIGSDWISKNLKPNQRASLFQGGSEMLAALMAGQVDALVTDTTILLSMVGHSDGQLKVVGQYKLDQGYGIVMPKGSKNVAAVDSVVESMMEDGQFNKLSANYLAPLYRVDPARIPVWALK
jgi:polar amino acid transport system substrate-binding protein